MSDLSLVEVNEITDYTTIMQDVSTGVWDDSQSALVGDDLFWQDYNERFVGLLQEASPITSQSLLMIAERLAWLHATLRFAEREGWAPYGDETNNHPYSHYKFITDAYSRLLNQWELTIKRLTSPDEWKESFLSRVVEVLEDTISSPELLQAIAEQLKRLDI